MVAGAPYVSICTLSEFVGPRGGGRVSTDSPGAPLSCPSLPPPSSTLPPPDPWSLAESSQSLSEEEEEEEEEDDSSSPLRRI